MDSELSRPLKTVYAELYYPHKLQGRSPHTNAQYLIQLRHFDRFLGRDATLADLTDETVTRCIGWLRQKRAAPTANKFRSHILALWRFLARKHVVPVWPDVVALPEPDRIPRCWSADELRSLFAACKATPGKIGGVQAGDWWFALHLVLWDTGERITAVVRSRWADLDMRDRWLFFPAENRKGGKKDRQFRLHPDTIDALRAIRGPAREAIFPWPWTPASLWDEYNGVLRRADLPTDRKSKFHRMRRSVATHAEAAGMNATEILGHSCRRVTESYLDPRFLDRPQPADVLFRPEGPQSG